MIFDIITLFPKMFDCVFDDSIIKKAVDKGLVRVNTHNLRDYTDTRHKVTDDYPFGGGCGMVMKVEPIYHAIHAMNVLKSDID